MIGHMGICDSAGIIYDFGGPYYIAEDRCVPNTHPCCHLQLNSRPAVGQPWPRLVVHVSTCCSLLCVLHEGGNIVAVGVDDRFLCDSFLTHLSLTYDIRLCARMTFGAPTRYMQLSPTQATALSWDRGVQDANEEYRKRMHNLCCDNCHSHVAYALNRMAYRGKTNWNMVILGWHIFIFGRFTR